MQIWEILVDKEDLAERVEPGPRVDLAAVMDRDVPRDRMDKVQMENEVAKVVWE